MAFPQWPAGLNPLPLREGYTFKPHDKILRSNIGKGLVQQRRLFGESDAFPTAVIPMSPDEFAAFNAFYEDTLYAGARWFEMPVRFGTELATCVVRIKSKSPQSTGADWLVTLELEVRDAPYLLEGGPYLAAVIGDATFEAFGASIHQWVHVTWPGYFPEA